MTGRGRTWRLALAGGCVVLLGSLTVLAPDTIVAQAAYFAGVFGSAAMALIGARRHAGRLRAAWTAVGLGLVASAVADAVWEFDVWRLGMEPDASLADIAYLASYVLLAVGLFRLPAAGTDGDDRVDVGLDSAMAGVIALLAVWQISLASILGDGDASALAARPVVGVPHPRRGAADPGGAAGPATLDPRGGAVRRRCARVAGG